MQHACIQFRKYENNGHSKAMCVKSDIISSHAISLHSWLRAAEASGSNCGGEFWNCFEPQKHKLLTNCKIISITFARLIALHQAFKLTNGVNHALFLSMYFKKKWKN